ncbi:MAG: metallophosphoesterase [Eggerthellaceae bacterium]|nr:metallophosphoesterase [Eggerthellaceae bacterium]
MNAQSRHLTRRQAVALLGTACATTSLGLAGCDSSDAFGTTHKISDYVLELPYKRDFKILQLTDIHLGNKDNRTLHYNFIDLTIRDANPDLIVITGDLFTFADKYTAKEVFDFFDGHRIPWTIAWGNHDEQCYFPIDWVTDYLNNYGSYCMFKDLGDDDVFGNSNHVINLMVGNTVKEQIIMMDSNRYNYGEYRGYDYIKQNQIDWYERLVTETTRNNGGSPVDSLCFFHIPFPEYADAWKEAQEGKAYAVLEYGEQNEGVSCPKINSGFFDKVLELGSTKAICVGHDHVNNWRIKYKGVYLCFGVHSTDRIYLKEDMLGGHMITIHEDNSLEFDHFYHDYSEVR